MSETPLERSKEAVDDARAASKDALDAATHETSELEQLTGGDARAESRRRAGEAGDEPDPTTTNQPG